MKISELGTVSNPVNVALRTTRPPSVKELIGLTLMTVLPIGIAILMQKPAMRQMLIMRATHYGKEFCHWQATVWSKGVDAWNKGGDTFAQAYNKAKL
jgi:hypothetical protein